MSQDTMNSSTTSVPNTLLTLDAKVLKWTEQEMRNNYKAWACFMGCFDCTVDRIAQDAAALVGNSEEQIRKAEEAFEILCIFVCHFRDLMEKKEWDFHDYRRLALAMRDGAGALFQAVRETLILQKGVDESREKYDGQEAFVGPNGLPTIDGMVQWEYSERCMLRSIHVKMAGSLAAAIAPLMECAGKTPYKSYEIYLRKSQINALLSNICDPLDEFAFFLNKDLWSSDDLLRFGRLMHARALEIAELIRCAVHLQHELYIIDGSPIPRDDDDWTELDIVYVGI